MTRNLPHRFLLLMTLWIGQSLAVQPVVAQCDCKICESLVEFNITPSDRQRRTPKRFAQFEMLGDTGFPKTSTLHQGKDAWSNTYEEISTGIIEADSEWLDMSKHDYVRAGDIVLLLPQGKAAATKPLVLFYCGEGSFPDFGDKSLQSFFIYPYFAGAEWNTFPPRQHKTMRDRLLDQQGFFEKLKGWIVAFFTTLSFDRDAGHKYVLDSHHHSRWLKTAITENYKGVFHHDKQWSSSSDKGAHFRYQILRIKQHTDGESTKGAFGGTQYSVDDEGIRIEFDPRLSKKVKSAEKIGFVQVVWKCIDERLDYEGSINTDNPHWVGYYKEIATKEGAHVDSQPFAILYGMKTELEILRAYQKNGPKAFPASDEWFRHSEENWSPSYNGEGNPGMLTTDQYRKARMHDRPHFNTDAGNWQRRREIFETWSWCEKGKDLGEWYDGLIWEYRIEQEPKFKESYVVVATELKQPSQLFMDAFKKFNRTWKYQVSNDLTWTEAKQLQDFLKKKPVTIYQDDKPREVTIDYTSMFDRVDINWGAIDEVMGGCQYRAQLLSYSAEKLFPRFSEGKLEKMFAIASKYPKGTLGAQLPDGTPVKWGFHVAPVLRIQGSEVVLDPSLLSPHCYAGVNTWKAKLNDNSGTIRFETASWQGAKSTAYIPKVAGKFEGFETYASYAAKVAADNVSKYGGVAPDPFWVKVYDASAKQKYEAKEMYPPQVLPGLNEMVR